MAIESGRRFGPYEIISLIGAGGMGEVYRARDTRLDRTVAIKILPPGLSSNAALRERFEREARAISAISHPNICALYDVGSADSTEYLVMEYLEGETLADRIARGPLPTSLIVRYGAQIAEALQKAHRAGITHRDLKPGNVMITTSGAKLLDFGLAKFIEPAGRVFSDHSAPTTMAAPLTGEGKIVGTLVYMSPEQLEGKPLDHRTDIFSLGVILYEMATAQRPFRGDTQASVIAAIMSTDPAPIRTLQVTTPPALERIIQTALEKNPEERWQTAQDVARQLRWISETSGTAEMAAPSRRTRFALPAAILVTALAAGLATWGATRWFGTSQAKPQTARLHLALPDGTKFRPHPEVNMFAISPDGRRLLFAGANEGRGATFLFLRSLDSYDVKKVEGTEGAVGPFWSSDGNWFGFTARGKLWKMRADGGAPPEAICDVHGSGARATWQGKTILFADSRGNRLPILRVSSDGGKASIITTLDKSEWRHGWPLLFPDGEHYLFLSFGARSLDRKLVLASLDSPGQTVLTTNVSYPRLLGIDRVAYVRDGKLLSQHVDFQTKRFADEPTTVASDVNYFYPTARADFDASISGVVVYRTDTSSRRLFATDRSGAETRVVEAKDSAYDAAISPDGRKAAVTILARDTGLMDIWIYDLTRGVRDQFTSEPGVEVSPAWSPDGRSIVFCMGEGGVFPHLVLRTLTGTTSEDLTPRDSFQFSPVFSRDGESVIFDRDAEPSSDIYRVNVKTKKIEPVINGREREFQPAPSPDGKWMAFTSSAAGSIQIYLQNLVDGSGRIRISSSAGQLSRWSTDARELFYISENNEVMSVVPGSDGRWDESTPKALFKVPAEVESFDVFPGGKSFLISTWVPGTDDDLFHVVIAPE